MNKNKEAKSSASAWAVAFCFAKQGGQILCSCMGQSHFASQNKEAKSSAPARAVAFCFAKQGGFYDF
jgi:hypothetical protein